MNNPSKGTFLGHPKGLFLLFSTELWERFSYYGMRAVLVLYLTDMTANGGMGWTQADALKLYGIYTGLVYITPIIGGWLFVHTGWQSIFWFLPELPKPCSSPFVKNSGIPFWYRLQNANRCSHSGNF